MKKFSNSNKLLRLLICPDCSYDLKRNDLNSIFCSRCKRIFEITDNNIILLPPKNKHPLPEIYSDPEYIEAEAKYGEIMKFVYESKSLVSYFNNAYHITQTKMIDKYSKKGEFIIDIGCGIGTQFKYISPEYHSLCIGLDGKRDFLDQCRKDHPETTLILGDLCQLPFKSDSIFNILCLSVLEHIYPLDLVLENIKRVLNNNGQFFMTLPTEGGLLWNTGRRFSTQRKFEKMGINYKKFVEVEHCNTAKKVLGRLNYFFKASHMSFYPFLLPSINLNLFINGIYRGNKNPT